MECFKKTRKKERKRDFLENLVVTEKKTSRDLSQNYFTLWNKLDEYLRKENLTTMTIIEKFLANFINQYRYIDI